MEGTNIPTIAERKQGGERRSFTIAEIIKVKNVSINRNIYNDIICYKYLNMAFLDRSAEIPCQGQEAANVQLQQVVQL